MKRKQKLHLMGILILVFCVSCGQSVKETIRPVVPGDAGGQFKRVVIIPFADHTPDSSFSDYCRRNTLVLESLQDALYGAGFISAAEEDVVKCLIDQGVIQASNHGISVSNTAALEQEIKEDWSDQMKEELIHVIADAKRSKSSSGNNTKSIALSKKILNDLGNAFNADYIVRGRIIEFRADQIDSFSPLRTGIIPFVFKSTLRSGFGVAETEMYEYIDKDAVEDYDRLRHLFWGAGGFLTGFAGEKQGRVPGATVQIRVLFQDAGTGEVVWLNRAEACSMPRTAFSDPDADLLFAKAIDTAVNSLVNDFNSAFNSGRFAKVGKKSITSDEPEGESKIESFVSELAAEKAERSAKEAKESADQARESAAQALNAADEAKGYAQSAGEAKGYAQEAKDAAGEAKDAVKRASEASAKSEKIFNKIIAK